MYIQTHIHIDTRINMPWNSLEPYSSIQAQLLVRSALVASNRKCPYEMLEHLAAPCERRAEGSFRLRVQSWTFDSDPFKTRMKIHCKIKSSLSIVFLKPSVNLSKALFQNPVYILVKPSKAVTKPE